MKGWWNESQNHAKAAKGVKVRPPIPDTIKSGTGNPTTDKHKLDDHIQNDMHNLDKLLRKASSTHKPEVAKQHIQEAETIYTRLATKIDNYKRKYGDLPYWVNYTWHGKENFHSRNGRVRQAMNDLAKAKPENIKTSQSKLYSIIKLPRDKTFTEVYG